MSHQSSVRDAIKEWDLGGIVTVAGSVSHDQLIREYQAADVFVIPSYHEDFCVPVLEALSCGCMVVGYDAGNLLNITAGLARLVPCGDRRLLADALANLIQMPRTATCGPMRPLPELDGGIVSLHEFECQGSRIRAIFQP
ncbi:MAG: glycosyltransferase [Bryobacteraceae bacterium]